MSGEVTTSRRTRARETTRAEILQAAWDLARERGLAALTMRDLGDRVGMRAQSLYSYFASKHEIYDALFADANRQFVAAMGPPGDDGPEAPEALTAFAVGQARTFFSFCTVDPVRFQLLFQRTIPGFEPSEASYGIALEAYEHFASQVGRLGAHDPRQLDMWSAVMTGLASQQIANDPGGDRWGRLVEDAVGMVLAYTTSNPVPVPVPARAPAPALQRTRRHR